jgi:hypothetical protein
MGGLVVANGYLMTQPRPCGFASIHLRWDLFILDALTLDHTVRQHDVVS